MQGAPTLNVVGCGRAGCSLVRLWLEAGTVRIGAVLNRSRASSDRAVADIGDGCAADTLSAMPPADFWLIGTGDDQIASVARELADSGKAFRGALVFHLAGRFGLEALAPLQGTDALLAALHPVRSLTHARLTIAEFKGTACVAEGRDEALVRLDESRASESRLTQAVEEAGGEARERAEHARTSGCTVSYGFQR